MAKVVVLGGGVGGLTVAHELGAKGHTVVVLDQRDTVGGKARSYVISGGLLDGMPAEHGFRFLPGFYKHLGETMGRIPFTGGTTVLDNLEKGKDVALEQVGKQPFFFPSTVPLSIGDWAIALWMLHNNPSLGLTADDQWHFAKRLLCILGSGPTRREKQYDNIDWYKFIDASRSAQYEKICANGLTRSLVAMRPKVSSTYTVGNVLLQFIMDILSTNRPSDRVLDGPTSDRWLDPWKKHLETSYPVTFQLQRRITAINYDTGTKKVTGVDHRDATNTSDVPKTETGDYYVCALPFEVARALLGSQLKIDADITGIDSLTNAWMNGIMYYLTRDVSMTKGHVLYLDSTWALTSINQGQFWTKKPDAYGSGAAKDILSAIISDWEFDSGPPLNKFARDVSEDVVRTEAWRQLKVHRAGGAGTISDADLVGASPTIGGHVGENIDYSTGKAVNATPLFINTSGSWTNRPTAATEVKNLFLAADYIQTNSNLACMESANEAGRRAANGILNAESQTADVPVYDFNEPAVFAQLRTKDDADYAADPNSTPLLCTLLDALPLPMTLSTLALLDNLVEKALTDGVEVALDAAKSAGAGGSKPGCLVWIALGLGVLILILLIVILIILV